MSFSVIGLNHKTAPVSVRERIAYEGDKLNQALNDLLALEGMQEAIIISTCNRSEFYVQSEHQEHLQDWIQQQSPDIDINQHLYQHQDADAVTHLYRVACGLDSLVLGEPQILGQLKSAYQQAKEQNCVGHQLQHVFEQAFSCAKAVRSETDIGANPISVAYAAVRLSQQIFGDLSQQRALLIGAGETNELVARHLHSNHIGGITIANRSIDKAQKLAAQFQGRGVGIADIPSQLVESDIIISSTASPLPILGKGMVETALKARKHRPFFMVDIAIPRDIETEVGQLDDVYLYNVDDLESVIEENRQSRAQAAEQAEEMIQLKTAKFLEWQRSQDATQTIQQLRARVDEISRETLTKAHKMIEQGKSPEETLNFLSHTLSNKILHSPSVQLRSAAAEGQHDLLQAAQKLFEL